MVDYRYARFALDERDGLFKMTKYVSFSHLFTCAGDLTWYRDWRDPSWTGVQSVKNGLDEGSRAQRLKLFGPNLIDIAAKSTITLMIDEVGVPPIQGQQVLTNCFQDHTSVLCLPNCEHHSLVYR